MPNRALRSFFWIYRVRWGGLEGDPVIDKLQRCNGFARTITFIILNEGIECGKLSTSIPSGPAAQTSLASSDIFVLSD